MKKIGINRILFIVLIIIVIILIILVGVYLKQQNLKTKGWNSTKKVNVPELLTGMTPVYFQEKGEIIKDATSEMVENHEWYDYNNQKWANAKTEDGSLWVWIPRYAYKITYIDASDKSKGGTIDIMFLKGITNKNEDGMDVTKLGYTVHPAFENGSGNDYTNGEWNEKLTGIWVSKFEAGVPGQIGTSGEHIPIIETDIEYIPYAEQRHYIEEGTKIIYPVFLGKTYSYNWTQIDEIYELSNSLTNLNNPYGLDESDANTHMMKNSEWGAVAYLSYSKYGTNGKNIAINNVALNKIDDDLIMLTGYGSLNENPNYIEGELAELSDELPGNSYAWHTEIGQTASTTRNKYGVFDMRGGLEEYVAGYSNNISINYGSFLKDGHSNELITVYKSDKKNGTMSANYNVNRDIYGDAVAEVSKYGVGYSSWNGQTSLYMDSSSAIFLRGGDYRRGKFAGLFSFSSHSGHSSQGYGFRAVIVKK